MEQVKLDAAVYAEVLAEKLKAETIRSSQMETLYLATKHELDALKAKGVQSNEVKTAE